MTRLSPDILEMIDILVKLNVYKSRSEAVASIVETALLSQQDKFEELRKQVKKLEAIQGSAKDIASEVIGDI